MKLPWRRSIRRSRKRPDEAGEGARVRWVKVTVAPGGLAAGMLGGALDSAGIPHFEKKLGFDFPMMPSNQVAIMVPEHSRERAIELLSGITEIRE